MRGSNQVLLALMLAFGSLAQAQSLEDQRRASGERMQQQREQIGDDIHSIREPAGPDNDPPPARTPGRSTLDPAPRPEQPAGVPPIRRDPARGDAPSGEGRVGGSAAPGLGD